MKKLFILSALIILAGVYAMNNDSVLTLAAQAIGKETGNAHTIRHTVKSSPTMDYAVYQRDALMKRCISLSEAVSYAKNVPHASVRTANGKALWDNYKAYLVYQDSKILGDYATYADAAQAADQVKHTAIYLRDGHKLIRDLDKPLKTSALTSVPVIAQMPELPRGCEVTSLSMLLSSAGIQVDKMTLAGEVKKDDTPYEEDEDGNVSFGNPNTGFVGAMDTFDKPGLAVYHGPIDELAEKYLPGRILDLSGADFTDMLVQVQQGRPVWVIANVDFDLLPASAFQTWETPSGPIQITYKEHSVLVTGYDKDFVYFNDPLTDQKNRKVPRDSFEKAWEQMGHQAITYID
ncbi:C39 family peptidase [Aneurinibacillus sp. Ricciae_BoGa-3]|uniref:C39 family peptidase n=1 Tax=Aneurinibacillus sp. Ricciae_BoGa-3 TaxID=3022697 RepID=UPI0023401119|nr:C39 family peptidase [Aneurinibacillus sp. Ricciae_BoGa-3]WCK56047.1 C39 family peptidase [Aneurinibacillus sp. Ricciae_BoGa-3]